jgi:hypothetical protein
MRIWLWTAMAMVSTVAWAAPPSPVQRFEAGDAGFIDDPITLRDDGKAVAFIVTDGATSATLHLADIGGNDVKIAGAPTDASGIVWLSPARVLVIRGRDGSSTAQPFTAAGAEKMTLGPFGRYAVATVDGKRVLVTYTRSEKRGVEHALVAYSLETLKPVKRRTWREDAEGQIKQGSSSVKPLWWADGFTVLAALRAGEYDKTRDMRRPDRYTRIDAFNGKVLAETEVQDVLAFTQISMLRRDLPNEPVIVRYSDDRKQLLAVDGITQYPVKLQRSIALYDFSSLQFQTMDARQATFSLTVDPVNPDAVARKKADPDDFDLYFLDRTSREARRVLTLAGEGRRSAWSIVGNRLALLRKGKGFDRGGVALEIYDVGDATSAARP